MMSEIWFALRSNSRVGTPHSMNASTISSAMSSVVCHMESYTTIALSSGASELHRPYSPRISATWLRQMTPWLGAIMSTSHPSNDLSAF